MCCLPLKQFVMFLTSTRVYFIHIQKSRLMSHATSSLSLLSYGRTSTALTAIEFSRQFFNFWPLTSWILQEVILLKITRYFITGWLRGRRTTKVWCGRSLLVSRFSDTNDIVNACSSVSLICCISASSFKCTVPSWLQLFTPQGHTYTHVHLSPAWYRKSPVFLFWMQSLSYFDCLPIVA